jgi:hypothetical protein
MNACLIRPYALSEVFMERVDAEMRVPLLELASFVGMVFRISIEETIMLIEFLTQM